MKALRTLLALTALASAACGHAPTATPPTASTVETDHEALFDWFEYQGRSHALQPGADQYRNPILAGFYPDPSIVAVGNDFYLINSSFSWYPGIPVFHSRDLVHWTQIGNAIDRPDMLDFGQLGMSRGVFAPAISHHDGLFYIVNTCVDCGGNFVIVARDPAGPWSSPVWLPELKDGIDPSLFFDDNGQAWIVNNGLPEQTLQYDGHRAIWIQRFDPQALKSFGARRVIVNGGVDIRQQPGWIEGPHLFRKNDWYYLIAAEGGTAEQHSEVVFRARAPEGPYQSWDGNPILTQRDLTGPRDFAVTSAGHADFVRTAQGDWWSVFLAVQPYADDLYNTGRETFLLPVQWQDGWPRITAPGQAIAAVHSRPALPVAPAGAWPNTGDFTLRDDFDEAALPAWWVTPRNPRSVWWSLSRHPGQLALRARPVGLGDDGNPSFWARRQQHAFASASTSVRFEPAQAGDRAGIAALQNDADWFRLDVELLEGRRSVVLARRAGSGEPRDGVLLAQAGLRGDGPVRLRITARGGRYDFDYAENQDGWRALLHDVDATALSTRLAGGFVGAMLGVFAQAAPAPASGS